MYICTHHMHMIWYRNKYLTCLLHYMYVCIYIYSVRDISLLQDCFQSKYVGANPVPDIIFHPQHHPQRWHPSPSKRPLSTRHLLLWPLVRAPVTRDCWSCQSEVTQQCEVEQNEKRTVFFRLRYCRQLCSRTAYRIRHYLMLSEWHILLAGLVVQPSLPCPTYNFRFSSEQVPTKKGCIHCKTWTFA